MDYVSQSEQHGSELRIGCTVFKISYAGIQLLQIILRFSMCTAYFGQVIKDEQPEITRRLNEFERQMRYTYIEGVRSFIEALREAGIKTAIVTASNDEKMQSVLRVHPELPTLFDRILTSKDYAAGKPAPDCYLEGAKGFDVIPEECVVFEDSINGLRAGRDSGALVVALTTTNPYEAVAPLADIVIENFKGMTLDRLWVKG